MIELSRLLEAGALSPIDVRFAEAVVRLAPHEEPARRSVLFWAALASRAVQRGHVCVDLERTCREPLLDEDGDAVSSEPWPIEVDEAVRVLCESPLVSDGRVRTPLVLAARRLYLYRYFDYERRLASALSRLASTVVPVDRTLLTAGLARLFPDGGSDEQREAVTSALGRRLAVISGGPGTGKTTTVAKLLALLGEQAHAAGERLEVALVAPTGKAAARLGESLKSSVAKLATAPEVRDAIPLEATTIHRLLGYQPRTPTRFRYGRRRPMSVDVLLADEASMIDLALMTKLVEAVPERARVILLGDKDQLASVEAGAVLADLCDAAVLAPCVSRLEKSYRFGERSGIAALARAIVEADADRALAVLRRDDEQMPYGEVALHPGMEGRDKELSAALAFAALQGFGAFLDVREPEARLAALGAFRILCAHRRGSAGVQALNLAVERLLRDRRKLGTESDFYDGRPILVTANDHQLGLFNGDIGVICHDRQGRRAFFPGGQGPRAIPLGRLPPHETVFAMTVHKSQGSEMDRVALVLPPEPSPILTRELLYTAVTRARTRLDVFGTPEVLRFGIGRSIERASGLQHALVAEPAPPPRR